MAQIVINIPVGQEERVLNALASHYHYDPASGLTKAQYVKQVIIDRLKEEVLLSERRIHASDYTEADEPEVT